MRQKQSQSLLFCFIQSKTISTAFYKLLLRRTANELQMPCASSATSAQRAITSSAAEIYLQINFQSQKTLKEYWGAKGIEDGHWLARSSALEKLRQYATNLGTMTCKKIAKFEDTRMITCRVLCIKLVVNCVLCD